MKGLSPQMVEPPVPSPLGHPPWTMKPLMHLFVCAGMIAPEDRLGSWLPPNKPRHDDDHDSDGNNHKARRARTYRWKASPS